MKTSFCLGVVVSALLVPVAIIASSKQTRRPPAFWTDLGPGRYSVGFRVLYYRDTNRKWHQEGAATQDPGRPIRVSVWYPAAPNSASRQMKYGDYLRHMGPPDFRDINRQLDESDMASWLSDLKEISPPGQPMLDKVLATPVAAYQDAPAAHGRFPLVLYSGGKASRADANVELGEYLASHGYVVATVPQLGPSDKEIELGSSPSEIALHADDFDSALKPLRALPDIDFTKIATAGHSTGGEVAVELALRHPEVIAVIGLDGSYGMTSGARVLKQLPGYSAGRKVNAALLDLRRAAGSQGVSLDLTGVDALAWSHLYRRTFAKAFHGDFTEWGMLAFKLAVPMPPNPDAHTRQIGYAVNTSVCRTVLDFLDARLHGSKNALQRLTAATGH